MARTINSTYKQPDTQKCPRCGNPRKALECTCPKCGYKGCVW